MWERFLQFFDNHLDDIDRWGVPFLWLCVFLLFLYAFFQ